MFSPGSLDFSSLLIYPLFPACTMPLIAAHNQPPTYPPPQPKQTVQSIFAPPAHPPSLCVLGEVILFAPFPLSQTGSQTASPTHSPTHYPPLPSFPIDFPSTHTHSNLNDQGEKKTWDVRANVWLRCARRREGAGWVCGRV